MRPGADRGIAIVGMAAVLPDAPDLTTFWANVVNGVASTGRIPPIAVDPLRYGFDVSTLQSTPPAHLLALEVTRRALADAGRDAASLAGSRASVIFATPAGQRDAVESRVVQSFDLSSSGAAGASSLDALAHACDALRSRISDLIVCGAIEPGDGTSTEAAVAVVLKRLADADRDGDRVYAVIRGVASATDAAQAIDRACADAGIAASSLGLVDGAPADFEPIEAVLAGADAGSVTLTSASSQVDETGSAAGLVSLVRAALALHHHVLPSTPNLAAPAPALSLQSPLVFNATAMPWPGSMQRAAVCATEAGGSIRSVLLDAEQAQAAESGLEQWPGELFLLRGVTLDNAYKNVDTLLGQLDSDRGPRLRDLSRSLLAGSGPVQIALVASSLDDLRTKLESTRDPKSASGVFFARDTRVPAGSKLAFLFPGQGSQRPGMLRDLFVAFPRLHQHLDAGSRWAGLILPPTPWTDADKAAQRERLTDTRAAQPALGVTGMAMADLLLSLGIRPDALGGHSYGELVALCVAGVFSEADLMLLSEARARCILDATETVGDPGSMAAVSADRDTVARLIEPFEGVVIANENSPEQTVISGLAPAVQDAVASIKASGLSAVQLQVACAFHSPVVAAGSATFREHLDRVAMAPPRLRVFSNTTAELYPEGSVNVRARLAEHIACSVQFVREVEAMYAEGVRIFVEVGPGRVLTGLVARILGSRPYLALNTDHATTNGVTQLLTVLAQLAVSGVDLDPEPLFSGRDAIALDLVAAQSPAPTLWVDFTGVRSSPAPAD